MKFQFSQILSFGDTWSTLSSKNNERINEKNTHYKFIMYDTILNLNKKYTTTILYTNWVIVKIEYL